MFWSKPKKDLPVVDLSGKYVYNTDILSIRKVDEIDLEYLRRHQKYTFSKLDLAGDTYYIVSIGESDLKIINQHTLDTQYTKLGE